MATLTALYLLMSHIFEVTMRLGIGTAQFGFDYGITNHTGKVPEKDAHRIISWALNME